jgi:hypothetical protein
VSVTSLGRIRRFGALRRFGLGYGAIEDFREAPVDDVDRAELAHDHVGRLEIAMDHVARMRVGHDVADLGEREESALERPAFGAGARELEAFLQRASSKKGIVK